MGCCCSAQQRDDSEFSKLATKPLIKHRSLSFDVPKDIKAGDLALGIHLKGCRTLQAGASGDCDPFVRFWLSSDPSKIQESTAKSRTQNPLWVPDEVRGRFRLFLVIILTNSRFAPRTAISLHAF